MGVEMYEQDNSYYLGKRPKDQIELLKSNDSYFFNDRRIQDQERERKPKRRLSILRRAKSYFLNNDQIHNDRYDSRSSFLNESDDRYGSRNSILNEADDSYYLRGNRKEVLPRHYNKMPINLKKDTSYDFLSKSIIKKKNDGNLIANDNSVIVEKSSKKHRHKTNGKKKRIRKYNGNNIYLAAKGGASFPANFKAKASHEIFGYKHIYNINGDLRNGETYELAIGKKLNRWRVEGAINKSKTNLQDPISYTRNTNWGTYRGGVSAPQKPNLAITSYMLNLYRDIKFNPSHKLSPYIGVGAGISNVKFDASEVIANSQPFKYEAFSGNLFSYNFIGGFNYELSKRYSMFTEASFNKINSFETKNVSVHPSSFPLEVDPSKSTNIMTGIRLDF